MHLECVLDVEWAVPSFRVPDELVGPCADVNGLELEIDVGARDKVVPVVVCWDWLDERYGADFGCS